jgi:hypothetical protein
MFRVLLYIFLVYLVYQFIFKFIIPVYKTTQQVKKGFHEMHERMNDFANNQEQPPSQKKPSSNERAVGDYIDFEEIK